MISVNDLNPLENESPLEFAGRLAHISASAKHTALKQKFGQFFTSVDIARFMTGLFSARPDLTKVSILDPGTGTAVLSCALIEKLAEQNTVSNVRLVCYEVDSDVLPFTKLSLEYLKTWLFRKGIDLDYDLHSEDFVIAHRDLRQTELFDLIISNPPFFKLQNNDERVQIAALVNFGQTNIYSIFIFIAARLLKNEGELLFLIPRSFCSGNFFRKFRNKLLEHLQLKHIHLFPAESRIFEESSVLSESVIVKGSKKTDHKEFYELKISCSGKEKIDFSHSFPFSESDNLIPLPASDKDLRVLEIINSWTGSLTSYGLKVYTGKINRSAAADHIIDSAEKTNDSVIFLDSSNEELFNIKYLRNCAELSGFFIPDKNYVIIRRYNTNFTGRRILASPYMASPNTGRLITVEKHLAFIDRPDGQLEKNEAETLAAILNSSLFDDYLRIVYGNINLSTEELSKLPLPPRGVSFLHIESLLKP